MSLNPIDRANFEALVRATGDPLVSLYVPVESTGQGHAKARIVLRNLLAQAEIALTRRGMRRTKAVEMLDGASRLGDDLATWAPPAEAIAVFVSTEETRAFRLPCAVSERMEVGGRFCVRPLLRAVELASEFYALVLDQAQVRLLHFGPTREEEVELAVPPSMEAFIACEHVEKGTQVHSAGRLGAAGTVIRHGTADPSADVRARLRRYAQAISRAVETRLPTPEAPLVLVGTQEFQDAFRAAFWNSRLVEEGVVGSPKMLSTRDIRSAAHPLALRKADSERASDLEYFRSVAGTGLTSCWIEAILPAARDGRVETLFVVAGREIRGRIDEARNEVHPANVQAPEGLDLIDEAVRATLLGGGEVREVLSGELHEETPLAAVFRY